MVMFYRIFLDHPRRCGQGYFEHLRIALSFSAAMLKDSMTVLIHAFFPAVVEQRSIDAVERYTAGLGDDRIR
jgi:hypothetical protein